MVLEIPFSGNGKLIAGVAVAIILILLFAGCLLFPDAFKGEPLAVEPRDEVQITPIEQLDSNSENIIEELLPDCVDSDGGNFPLVAGTCTDGGGSHADTCGSGAQGDFVIDYSCQDYFGLQTCILQQTDCDTSCLTVAGEGKCV